jgi:hypothetical protein
MINVTLLPIDSILVWHALKLVAGARWVVCDTSTFVDDAKRAIWSDNELVVIRVKLYESVRL